VLHDVAILVSLIVFVKQGYSLGVVWIARDCRELVTKNRFYLNLRKTLFAYSNEFTDYQNAREENLHNVIFESDCLSLVFRLNSSTIDEVLTRQCPCLRAFDLWSALWDPANSTAVDKR
jgi:hypothetical protein